KRIEIRRDRPTLAPFGKELVGGQENDSRNAVTESLRRERACRRWTWVGIRDTALAQPQMSQLVHQREYLRDLGILRVDEYQGRELVANSKPPELLDAELAVRVVTDDAAAEHEHPDSFRLSHEEPNELINALSPP